MSRRNPAPWLTVLGPNAAAPVKLICFPYAGGSASAFRSWPADLPPQLEVAAIQLPGRGTRIRDLLCTDLRELVAELGAAIAPALDRPYMFFGHSLGALVSFEAVMWLRRHNERLPTHLFVSGRRAPQFPVTDPPLSQQNDDEILTYLQEMNGTPPEIFESRDFLRMMLPVVRADCLLGETYHYAREEPLRCPITAFGGIDDEESLESRLDGWRVHTLGPFRKHLLPGGHFFVQSSQRELLALMQQHLEWCRWVQ